MMDRFIDVYVWMVLCRNMKGWICRFIYIPFSWFAEEKKRQFNK